MLAEILLSGLAAANVGAKTTIIDKQNQLLVENASENNIGGAKSLSYGPSITPGPGPGGGDPSGSSDSSYPDSRKFFSINYEEKNENYYGGGNDTVASSELIDEYCDFIYENFLESYDGFKYTINGYYHQSKDTDKDFYTFRVFRKSCVTISLENHYSNSSARLSLYKYYYEKGEEGEKTVYTCKSDAIREEYGTISAELDPGTYCVYTELYEHYLYAMSPDDYLHYTIKINGSHYSDDSSVNLSELIYAKGCKAVAWIPEFDPFGTSAFDPNVKEIKDDFLFKKSIEKVLMDGECSCLRSSLYLWGVETRNFVIDIVNGLRNQLAEIKGHYKKIKIEALEKIEIVELVRNILKNAVDVVEIGVDFAVFGPVAGAAAITNKTLNLASEHLPFDLPEVKSGLDGAELDAFEKTGKISAAVQKAIDWIADIIINYLKTLIPEEQILECEALESEYKGLLDVLCTSSLTSEQEIIKINTYFKIKKLNDNDKNIEYSCTFKNPYKENDAFDYPKPEYSILSIDEFNSKSILKGRFYPIGDFDDYEKALKHIYSKKNDVNSGGDTEITLWSGGIGRPLHEHEYHWYHFTAPVSATYRFYSSCSDDFGDNINPYGELFFNIVPGFKTEGVICADDDSYGGKNFKIDYTLEKGQTIYIRVRGSEWKSHGQSVSLNVQVLHGKVINIGQTDSYFEDVDIYDGVNIDPIKYTFCFENSGYRILQTFGDNDTIMRLFDGATRILLEESDNDGYGENAFINYNFESDKTYYVEIFARGGKNAFIKTSLTAIPAYNGYFKTAEQISSLNVVNNSSYSSYSLDKNNFVINNLRVSTSGTYLLNTTRYGGYIGKSIYLIDPESVEDSIKKIDFDTEVDVIVELVAGKDYYLAFGSPSTFTQGFTNFYVNKVEDAFLNGTCYLKLNTYINAGKTNTYYVAVKETRTYKIYTYGAENTNLHVYDIYGNHLYGSSNNSGYKNNEFLTTRLEKGQVYKISVSIYGNNKSGSVGLLVAKDFSGINGQIENLNVVDITYEDKTYNTYEDRPYMDR